MVFIRYVVNVYNMALNTNIWVLFLIFGLKSDLVHGICAFPGVPMNSELKPRFDSDHVFQDGDVVKYQCNDGYSISGYIARSCTNGQWTTVRFTCNEITCGYTEPPDNGRIVSGVTYEVGSFVRFECNEGFKLKGDRRYLCGIDGQWRYTSATKCEPIMCPSLDGIQYGSIFQDSSDGLRDNYMSVAEYTCIRGYKIFGKELRHMRTCQADGQWSGREPYCEAPVCDEISPFYGGRPMFYNDNRREHAVALLRCDNGYSLYPTGIKSIRCKTAWSGELEWTPEPPLCYKNLKVEVPNNCLTSASSNVELTHRQSFTLSPRVRHEFYATKNYLTSSSLTITNNNGTFDPPLPQCVPERCNAWSLRNSNSMHVYFPNNTRATGQVDSHTEYNLGCMDKYEFEAHDFRNQEYVVRRCEYGQFKNVPKCIEKRCVLTNDQLELSQGGRSSLELVEHNSRVDVNCKSDGQELYSNEINNYLKPFSTRCEYGQFDTAVNTLNCVPKRCVLTNDRLELSQVSRSGHVAHNSQVDVNCKSDRHELYSNALKDYVNPFRTRCEYGQFYRAVNSLSCVPKRCVLTNDQLELSQSRRSSHVAHNSRIDVSCKSDRHELYNNVSREYVPFNIQCEYGQFHPEVNSLNCVPKRCNTTNLQNMNVYQLNDAPVSLMVDSHHKYKLECTDGYELKDDSYLNTPSIERSCKNGDFVNVSKCVAKRCFLNNMDIKLTSKNSQQSLQKVAHDRAVDVGCNSNHLQLFNQTLRAYIEDFSIKCKFGHFDIEVNSLTCVPKPCDTKLLAHTKVYNADEEIVEGLLAGDVTYKLTCESEKYVFKEYPDVGNIKRRCEDGSFQNVSNCIQKPCKWLHTDEKLQYRFNTHVDHIGNEYIVQHNAEVFVSCKPDYELYYNRTDTLKAENETTITCRYGNMGEIPKCAEKRCKIHIKDGECYQRKPGSNKCISAKKSFNVRSGKPIYLQCENNYTLEPINAKTHDRFGSMKCTKGILSQQYRCNPDPCQKPEISNATTNYTNTNVTSGDTIVFTCVERHHMSGTTNKRTWEGKCKSGTITNVPADCIQDNCEKPNGHFKMFGSQTVITDQFIQHGKQIQLECFDGFNFVDSNNEIVNITTALIHCDRGILLDYYQCKRCRNRQGSDNSSADTNELNTTTSAHHPENRTCDEYGDNVNMLETSEAGVNKDCTISESTENSKFTYTDHEGNEIVPPQSVMDGRQITVECKYDVSHINDYYGDDEKPTKNIICVNGTLGSVSMTCLDSPANCTLSESTESRKYTYTDDKGEEIVPPYSVMNGRQITVECKSDFYTYDTYDVTDTENITCVNGKLDSVSMVCEDSPDTAAQSDPCQKFEVQNGTVTHNAAGMYYVLCKPGYTLNIPKIAHEKPCTCSEGGLVCFAETKPVCKAADCEIPFGIDRRLSVYESPNLYLTQGDKISDQQYVFFNCPSVEGRIYEPVNRRFQCVRGKFIEADSDPVWKLNHNGTFPKCIEVKCDPLCQNGGVCFRDGECNCEHMTTGVLCETFLCDESCAKNGGECVSPGKCGKCPTSRRGDNCEIEKICEFPSKAATYNDGRTKFSAGESIFRSSMACDQGYTLSSVEVMTCQDDGTWTDIIRCHRTNFKYVVRLQVVDKYNDPGTYDNVYVRIDGHGEQTRTTKMNGYFGRNYLVENEIRGIDVRPIQRVVVTKDKGMIDDHLSILYVSIFIEESDDYYVFTKDDKPVWLTVSKPVELSLSHHPERCIHTYGEVLYRAPTGNYRGANIGSVSLRECKQRCATTRSLSCYGIYFMQNKNNHLVGYCYHNRHSPDSNFFRDNRKEETDRKYVSYKRICREP